MKYDHYESGSLYGIRYEFRTGEKLWPHVHTGELAEQAHNIIVLRGRICLRFPEHVIEMEAGAMIDFDNSLEHSIEALEPSVTLHLMLHGKPPSFEAYACGQKHGEI